MDAVAVRARWAEALFTTILGAVDQDKSGVWSWHGSDGKGWEANEYPWSAYNACIFSGFLFMYHEAIISGSFLVSDHLCGTNASGRFAISD